MPPSFCVRTLPSPSYPWTPVHFLVPGGKVKTFPPGKGIQQTMRVPQIETQDKILGPNHKHLARSRGTVSSLPKATELQLCLLPAVAWQRLSVAFRQT